MKKITLLAIETSCDETGVAVVMKENDAVTILADAVASQIDIHAATGGVVPEVAAREHVAVIQPMIKKVLADAKVEPAELDGIAVTVGPGLMPALAVGVQTARTLSYAWQKPIIPIHHIEGHVYSALLNSAEYKKLSHLARASRDREIRNWKNAFPALALIVSGGHTLLIEVTRHTNYKILGTTVDDAAGEAFDKVARLIGLPYPGGPTISELATKGDKKAFDFPRPMTTSGNHNFSFSGLKTSVLYAWKKIPDDKKEQLKADIAASFQEAVIDTLCQKTERALKQKPYQQLLVGGGVAANQELQERLKTLTTRLNIPLSIAKKNLLGDNAAMIGQAGVFAYEAGRQKTWHEVDAQARISLEDFSLKH